MALLLSRLLILLLLGLAAAPGAAQGFEEFARAYAAAPPDRRESVADAFLRDVRSRGAYPFVSAGGLVTFFYRADRAGRSVAVKGDFTPRGFHNPNWAEAGVAMRALAPGGTIHVLQRRFERDARIDYQLVVDGVAQPDPLNPRRRDSGIYGEVSELVMPGYREPTLLSRLGGAPAGRIIEVEESWARPRVRIYLPAGHDPGRRYPALYVPDGAAWFDYLRLPQMLDAMIADGRIRPVIAVFMDAPEDRSRFYYFAPDYLDYVDRVVAYVDAHFPTVSAPGQRTHFGTSAGARAALFAALERPRTFGNIAMLSPSISGPPHFFAPLLTGERHWPGLERVWISAGTYEGAILEDARLMERLFRASRILVRARYTSEGHSFAAWRDLLPETLEFFFRPGAN